MMTKVYFTLEKDSCYGVYYPNAQPSDRAIIIMHLQVHPPHGTAPA